MATHEERKVGRPGRPRTVGERVPLGLRVTTEMRAKLNEAATASGRSLSQEAELRLEHSFKSQDILMEALDLAYGRHLTALLMILARAMQEAGTRGVFISQWDTEGCEDWLSDPFAYDQAVRAATTTFLKLSGQRERCGFH